ncbi:vomeronasal type-2 receptor 26-like [Anomaloglossus baeobatrachus]|uniref:vomeronasal type-2 receptor 26-like n=1 Tax=Anomaloglossus baeobatrachus TaxID=238106 RepID=UPI003F503676
MDLLLIISDVVSAVCYLLFLIGESCGRRTSTSPPSPCRLSSNKAMFQYEYYQEGDITIGGIFTVNHLIEYIQTYEIFHPRLLCTIPNVKNYATLMTLIFAIDEINKKSDLLPNITLGYHLYDTCGDSIQSVQNVLSIMTGQQLEVPNYSCRKHGEVAAFIGDMFSMAQLLGIYGYSKISYNDPDQLSRTNDLYRTFFTTTQHEDVRYMAISGLMVHYKWDWVGILTPFDNSGEAEAEKLRRQLNVHKVCVAFIIQLSSDWSINSEKLNIIQNSNARVIIICGKFHLHYGFLQNLAFLRENITFILHESWSSAFHMGADILQAINCSLILTHVGQYIPDLESFLDSTDVTNRPNDPILEDILYFYFACFIPNENKQFMFEKVYTIEVRNCTGGSYPITSQIARLTNPTFYQIYTAVYILAHALREMMITTKGINNGERTNGFRGKLQRFLRKVSYIDHTGQDITFNKNGGLSLPIYLLNWIYKKEASGYTFRTVDVGYVQLDEKQVFVIVFDDKIQWKTGKIPQSQCTEACPTGYRKAYPKHIQFCCNDCAQCSAGEISNVSDSEHCYKCPDDEWPDEKKVRCIPKSVEFLSYTTDILTSVFSSISLFFSVITLIILRTFIFFWDTPLVKANNRIVSFTLLVSILLSFLCVFLFLGRPVDVTCLLRQISFGFFFSVSVSSVLAKTIMVCIVFRATRPGSSWKKWMEAKYSYYVIVTCSSIQVLICVLWLLVSPPYQDADLYSYLGKIIIECNEGSDIWFYSMLGYLGLLAAVSFVLAFMVRTLPDSFNEAKYITFSMLVFCSVWIAMIPAYLSTKGKYMVAVEIFAILTSCAGILVCIFFPKCYILIMKPELNCRKQLVEKLNY